jgi:oligopeptide transport system substrate-binding protein
MLRALLPLVLVGIVLAGCRGGFSDRNTNDRTGVLRYALAQEPVTFDPGRVQDPEGIDLLGNIFEGLVAYDAGNRIVPLLAESYEPRDEGRVWEFRLKRNVRFHSGRAVTAADFKWSLERNLAPELASPTALNYLGDIVGAEAVSEGRSKELTGVQVVDDHTLRIELKEPRPYFLGKITYPVGFVLDREAAGSTTILNEAGLVGTGPYRIGQIAPDQRVTLEAFDEYHGGAPSLARIERPVVKDAVTRLNMYRQGELHMLAVQRTEIEAVRRDADLSSQLRQLARPVTFYIGLNRNLYRPFQDVRVRRAVAMAIDRERIAGELLNGMPPGRTLVAHEVMGYRPDYQGLQFNPEEARRLLADAGYPGGRGLPAWELSYIEAAPDSRIVVEGVEASLRQHLGFPVRLRSTERSVFFERRNASQLQGIFLSWGADYLDPQNFLSFLFLSDSPMNFDGYRNADFDAVAREADRTVDEGRRIELYHQAEDILIQDVARIPLYYGQDSLLVRPSVKDLDLNLMGMMPQRRTRIE